MKRLLALPAFAALALPVFAQDPAPAVPAMKVDPLVAKIAENLPKLKDAKWEGTHTFNATHKSEGVVNGSVAITWQDVKHFKVVLNIKTTPGETAAAAGQEAQDINANLFADGTHLWVISPMVGQMMGGMEGVKVELALIEKMLPTMMGQMGGGMAANPADIKGMVEKLAGQYTVKEEGSTDALKRLMFEGSGWKGNAQFDSKTWFPMSMQMGSEEEGVNVVFKTNSFSLKESFPDGTFKATGVDATKVMDLTGMIQAQMGGLGGGGDDDLEF